MATCLEILKKISDLSSTPKTLSYGIKIAKIARGLSFGYDTKLVAMATPLKKWKKRSASRKFTQIPLIWWNDRENRSNRSWHNLYQIKKEEINASKIYSPSGKFAERAKYPGPILLYRFGRRISGDAYPIFVWRSPKGRCYGNELNVGNVCKRRVEWPLLFASAFDNWWADHKSAFKKLNGNNQATSCPNLVNFRPIISDFSLLKRAISAAIRPQSDDDLHSSRCRFETHWKIAILIQHSNQQSFLYTLWKFREIRFRDSDV